MREVFYTPEYWVPLAVALVIIIASFVFTSIGAKKERKVTGAAYRALPTTALTLLGLLLPFSGAALAFVLRLGREADAGLLLSALTLYPVVLVFSVWALAGSMRYADKDDVLVFTDEAVWGYTAVYGAVYALLVSAIILTALFFILHADVFVLRAPVATVPGTTTLSRQPIRIGDSRAKVAELWGKPDSVSASAGLLYYSRPDTLIAVYVTPKGTVRSVLVGGMP